MVDTVKIIDCGEAHYAAFRDLNYHWINKYFKVEDSDRRMLENPKAYILAKGGAIVVAVLNDEVVGVCALVKMKDGSFELAKMAVDEAVQGQQIGWKLGLAVIEKAKQLGASRLYLETNHRLTPAISLYKKLGFTSVSGNDSPYSRCDVQMSLAL